MAVPDIDFSLPQGNFVGSLELHLLMISHSVLDVPTSQSSPNPLIASDPFSIAFTLLKSAVSWSKGLSRQIIHHLLCDPRQAHQHLDRCTTLNTGLSSALRSSWPNTDHEPNSSSFLVLVLVWFGFMKPLSTGLQKWKLASLFFSHGKVDGNSQDADYSHQKELPHQLL